METLATNVVQTGPYETYLNRTGEGNAEAILFLHGSGPGATAWSNWQFALPALGERYDCIAPDLVGFGQSEHPEDPPEGMSAWLDVWVGQAVALLDNLGLKKAHLVGNSMGGAVAEHLVDRHPGWVEKVVLMGTAGAPHRITEQLDTVWGFYDDPTEERMARILSWFAYDPSIVGDDLEEIARMRLEAAMDPGVRRSFSAMFPAPRQRHVDALAPSDGALARMDRPVLLIHGRDDGIVPLETSLYLLERLPRVQLHVFGRCSHWTMIEYKDEFNRLLADFFGGEL
jgi:2-hydroxymuconate-semialdehyde hydrolase